ncbi:unnamed protein product, partial [Allacma fusca]
LSGHKRICKAGDTRRSTPSAYPLDIVNAVKNHEKSLPH